MGLTTTLLAEIGNCQTVVWQMAAASSKTIRLASVLSGTV